MPRPRTITIRLTPNEAKAMHWRAGDASPECFDHEEDADDLNAASESGLAKLAAALRLSKARS